MAEPRSIDFTTLPRSRTGVRPPGATPRSNRQARITRRDNEGPKPRDLVVLVSMDIRGMFSMSPRNLNIPVEDDGAVWSPGGAPSTVAEAQGEA